MDKIKFRAWDVYNKIMRDVEEIDWDRDDGTLSGLLEEHEGDDGGRVFFNEDVTVDCSQPYDEYVILMEYPPISTDIHGNELCEGDIIKEHPNDHIGVIKKDMGNFFVEWNGGYPDWSWSEMCYDHMDRIEKIGNIYENPELWEESA